jgi:GntR family transcriptional regulator
MEAYGVSRLTIRRALEPLAERGLITRHRGRGTFVTSRTGRAPVRSTRSEASRQHLDLTQQLDISLISRSVVKPAADVREHLELDRNEKVEQFVVVRRTGDEAIALIVKDLPLWASELVPSDEVGGFPAIVDVLEEHGIVIHRVRQRIGAELCDPTLATRLGVLAGSPVLVFTRVSYDEEERPVIHARAYFRADRFEYDMEFADDGMTI